MRKILLLISILIIMISCSSTRNNGYEKFILPENFEGSVIVLYDEKETLTEENKDGKYTVYEIPENGVYYTKKEIATGTINHKYYRKIVGYYEEIRRVTFPLLENETIDIDSIYVMDLQSGEFSKRPIGSEDDSSNYGKVKFISFLVVKYEDREKLINKDRKKIDSLQGAYIKSLYKE